MDEDGKMCLKVLNEIISDFDMVRREDSSEDDEVKDVTEDRMGLYDEKDKEGI